MKIIKHFFQKLAFEPVDPLGDGLREMIEEERREPGAIILTEDELANAPQLWSSIDE